MCVHRYARNGRLDLAEGVLDRMGSSHGVSPSSRSFNTLIKGYSYASNTTSSLLRAFAVVRRMREALGPDGPNEVTPNPNTNPNPNLNPNPNPRAGRPQRGASP